MNLHKNKDAVIIMANLHDATGDAEEEGKREEGEQCGLIFWSCKTKETTNGKNA